VKVTSWLVLALVGASAGFPAPGSARTPAPGEGMIPVTGGKVWYRVVGTGKGTPLLVLHGGPGVPSDYLFPLAALGDERPVIFYDQLGCGRSDRPDDGALWTVDHYVKELGEVREALGLDEVDLYGHSWGAALAIDYMLAGPKGVKSLILAGPLVSARRWALDADTLLAALPDSLQEAVARNEAAGTFEAPDYQAAVQTYYARYLVRTQPWPADVDSAFTGMGVPVYMAMCGPSEFTLTGSLKDYDRTADLGRLKLPVLFITGEYDEVRPATVRSFRSLVPGAKLVIVPGAGHLAMQDAPEAYAKALREFLDGVDGRKGGR
jgi:proline iminopeptidase